MKSEFKILYLFYYYVTNAIICGKSNVAITKFKKKSNSAFTMNITCMSFLYYNVLNNYQIYYENDMDFTAEFN